VAFYISLETVLEEDFRTVCYEFLLRPRERLRSIVMSMYYVWLSVCLSVCLSARISPQPHVRSLPISCACCYTSVARFSSGMLMIGRIAYRREGVFFPTDNASISGTTRAIFTKFFLCMLPGSLARSSFDVFTKGFSSPLKMHYRPEKGIGVHSAGEVGPMPSTIALLYVSCLKLKYFKYFRLPKHRLNFFPDYCR